jgi:hypothetical protein
MRRGLASIIAVLIAGGVAFGAKSLLDKFSVSLPIYPRTERTVWLDRNWSSKEQDWLHHADQGTLTFGIPYEWFIALEQPVLSIGTPGLLSDPSYLDRYGFIPGSTESSGHELPGGFARGNAPTCTRA